MTVSHSQLFHGPTPRSPLHRLSIRLRRSRTTTSTKYSLPGATQLSQVRSVSPSERMVVRFVCVIHVFRVLPCVLSVAVQCPVCPVFVVPALPRSLLRVSHVPRRSPGVFFVFTVPIRYRTGSGQTLTLQMITVHADARISHMQLKPNLSSHCITNRGLRFLAHAAVVPEEAHGQRACDALVPVTLLCGAPRRSACHQLGQCFRRTCP